MTKLLKNLIIERIRETNGKLPFSAYMDLALYTPGLGYYMRSDHPFGKKGDFVTAPEISPLFGQCLSQSFSDSKLTQIAEFGAGTGKLAKSLLAQENIEHYFIIEFSPALREVQKKTLEKYLSRITWCNDIPAQFEGIILANEIIDAFPATKFCWKNNEVYEYYVTENAGEFFWHLDKPRESFTEHFVRHLSLPENYTSECHLDIAPWISHLSNHLKKGAIYIIDYGFPRHEFYHPERHQGTLMCHSQHKTHSNPLLSPGDEDITAHVDFTAIAEAAIESSLEVNAYTSQEAFLLDLGITNMAKSPEEIQAVKLLIHPAEMGELFKVMLLTRNTDTPFHGFSLQDRRNRL